MRGEIRPRAFDNDKSTKQQLKRKQLSVQSILGRSVIVSMDSKLFFVFLLLVGISHGLECYIHFPEASVNPTKLQCGDGFDLCATGMYLSTLKLITMKIHNFDCRH